MPSSVNLKFGKNLPKVTQYVRNLGKSVTYSTVDYFKGTMEDTSDFIETNQELFKDIYHAAKDYRRTMRAVDRNIRTSKVYEAGQGLKKSLFESIRTGKFYDAKRQAEYELQAAGDMGKMDGFDDEWGSSNEFDIQMDDQAFDQSNEGKSSSIISGAIQDATSAQAGIIARSTDYLAETQKASTKLLFAQGEKMYATVNNGLANTQALISRVNMFLEGPLTTHMENSTKFYQETTNKMNEITAMIKESLEMQRNLYKKEQESYKQSQFSEVGTNPDLREYAKAVKKNFMEFLGPEAQMLLGDDMGDGSNMFMALVANPLKFIPDFLVRSIVPVTIKKSLESLDKSFTGLFANMIARFNNWAKDTSDAPEFLKQIGRIFGLKMDNKTSMNTGKYQKGAIPFDGVTKKAITEVIPGYLARIESALTSSTERIFDYNNGKWTDIKSIERDYKTRRSANYKYGAFDISDDVREYISELKKHDAERAKRMEESYNKIIKKIYEDYGQFEPYRAHGFGDDREDPWDYYDIDKDDFLRLARLMVGTKNNRNRNAMQLAAAMQDARESWSRQMRNAESSGYDVLNQLFNNAYKIDMNSDNPSIGKTGGTGLRNVISNATDKYNKNIFFYLRGIYSELITIRSFGGFGGRRGRNGRTPPPTDPLADLERKFNLELDAEAARQANANINNANQQDDFNEDAWENIRKARQKEEEEELKRKGIFGRHNQTDSDKGFLAQLLEAGSLGAKFRVIQNNINTLLAKPGLAIAGVIDTADKRLFQLVFGSKEGEEITDREGRTVKGFLEYMVMRTRETFDKMNDWIDENILEPLKAKLGVKSFGEFFVRLGKRLGLDQAWDKVRGVARRYTRPVIDRLKYKGSRMWAGFRGSMGRTYGAAYRNILSMIPNRQSAVVDPSNFMDMGPIDDGGIDYDSLLEYNNPDLAASGGLVTRRGLAIISPGERIIPIGGKVTQRNNLTAERAFARRYGIKNTRFYAGGTGNPADQPIQENERDAVERTIKKVTNEVMDNTQNKGIANVIASGLIGGGVSLLTGLVGGPLLGAAVGSAVGIAENSKTVQNWLFGEEVVDAQGNKSRSGGVISKDLQDKFKKYFPSMKDFGLAGAVAGLFTPFGIVGGLLAGSAIGFVKETDGFKDFIYGKEDKNGERDGGLLKKEFRDRVKKAAPQMLVGAVGGALLGPFGILGNAVLGSSIGYITTTDKFKELILGKEDEHGKRKGGLVEALYSGLVKPFVKLGKDLIESTSNFVEKRIFKPLEDFVNPFTQMIKNGIVSIGDSIKDYLAGMFERTIGRPLHDFLEHTIFDNVRKWMGRIFKIPIAAARGLISAPFSLLGFVGNNIRSTQIAKGTAGNMTAQERLDWREQHRFRMFGKEIIGHDKYRKLDEQLANLKGSAGIERMEQMRDQLKIYLDTRGEMGKQVAEQVKKAGEVVSDFFNGNMVPDGNISIYTAVGSGIIKKIHKAISKGDMSTIEKICKGFVKTGLMSPDQMADFLNQISPYISSIISGIEKRKNASSYQQELQNRLGSLTGGTLSNTKNIRRFSRMLDNEIDARKLEEAKDKASGEQKVEHEIPDIINQNTNKIVTVLLDINENLKLNRMTPKERKKYLRGKQNTESQITENESNNDSDITVIDDLLIGSEREAINVLNNSYHTVEADDGSQTLMDSNGRSIATRSARKVKKNIEEKEKERKEAKSWREKLNDSLFGRAIGGVTKLIGGAKNGLFGLLGGLLNKAGPVFDILKWVFVGGTAIALTGHGSGLVKDILWPFVRDKVGPWLIGTRNDDGVLQGGLRGAIFGNKNEYGEYEGGIISGFANWFTNTPVFKFFNGLWDRWKENGGFGGFVQDIVKWYGEGFRKFADNIAEPLAYGITKVLPDLIVAIGRGVWNGIKSWFSGEDKTGDTVDKNGQTSVSRTISNNPDKYTSNSVSNNTLGNTLGLTTSASNTFFRDQNGNQLFKDSNNNAAVRITNSDGSHSYVYEDGTIADQNTKFTLVKENEYSKYSSNKTPLGVLTSGIGTNLISGLAGYNIGGKVIKLPTFSAASIGKNAKNVVTKINPISKILNMVSGGLKTGWNTIINTGSASRTIGDSIRKNGGSTLSNFFANKFGLPKASEAVTYTSNLTSGIDDAITSTMSSVGTNAIDDAIGYTATTASGSVDDIVTTLGRAASSAAGAVDDVGGMIGKIKTGITTFFTKIGENKVVRGLLKGVAKIFGTSIDDVLIATGFKEAGELLAKKVGENVVKSSLKSLVNALAVIPIATIVLAVGYFVSGWNDAHNIFGIAKDIDIPIVYNVVAGLVNAVKNSLPGVGIILAFIPTSVIIDLFTDKLLPMFGWDNSNLKKLQEESQKKLDEYNATVGIDQQVTSIEDYNEATHPGLLTKIKNTAVSIGSSIKNFFTGGNGRENSTETSGFSRYPYGINARSGLARHIYQNAANLSKRKFGNSTIGDAGCGPVAATNLLNRLSGRGPGMDLDSATNMALGYTDSTGGTTMDYFKDILNANGYGATETNSKQDLLSSIASGNPAVLLGNSGKEHGTPFGANNHYINAMGIDKSGKNMIIEDPDLPQSTVKYPIKDVMKDTISGVATHAFGGGFGRNFSDFFKRRKNRFIPSGKSKTNMVTVSAIALRAAPILYSGESGGNYSAINANDNGAVSVGLIQWHGARAWDILYAIVQELGSEESIKILGTSLYNKIVTKTRNDWETIYFSKGSTEVNNLKTLLNTEESKKIQNAKVLIDLDEYIKSIKNLGVKDEDAIIFMCHIMNAWGYVPDRFINGAKNRAGSIGNITLDDIYDTCMADSYYKEHYGDNGYGKKIYNAIKNSTPVGDTTTTIDAGSLTLSTQSTVNSVMEAANTDASTSDNSLMSIITNAGYDVFRSIYGDDLANFLGGSSTSSSSGDISTTGTGVNVNISSNASVSTKQKALVDAMAAIKGKINYGLGAIQDPERGTASCASTVAWAYNKVLGFRPGGSGYASSTSQSKDSKFTDIYVNNGGGHVPLSNLQPGDIMYFNWDRTTNNNNMQHTEMYAGNGFDWSHGGNPQYGPVEKDLNDYRLDHLMKVRRYNEFMSGSGRSRKKYSGKARIDTSTIQKANNVIRKYGINSSLISQNSTNNDIYAQYFSAMITLLSVIADNTEALSSLQSTLASRGVNISNEQLQKAAGNARKRAAKARQVKNTLQQNSRGFIDFGDSTDMNNILNGPTGYIVKTMEALAQE